MSSFMGVDLFGSGPHRFEMQPQGQHVVPLGLVAGDPSLPGAASFGDRQLRVGVRGRLVASSASGLQALRDAIGAKARQSAGKGVLADGRGRSWPGMALIEYAEQGPPDHGRAHSIAYHATFGELA